VPAATPGWMARTLPSLPAGKGLIEGDARQQQEWCNFLLLRPASLPGDLSVASSSVRPEAPPGRPGEGDAALRPDWTQSNRACHRAVYAGRRRRLRVKQFLYDYAPPAFDHPCLWESARVEPFVNGGHIGWLGTDFRRLRGATTHVDRTLVELSVIDGRFSDDELVAICRGLRPAVPELRDRLLATPLVDLCYRRRHVEPPIAVPVGYWAHKRREDARVSVYRPEEAPAGLAGFDYPGLERSGYRLRGLFVFGDEAAPQEVDRVFEHRDDPGRHARLLISTNDVPGGLPFPPRRETRQPCSQRTVEIARRTVHHAFLDARYGQHEAVWSTGPLTFMLIVKPTPETGLTWFEDLLRALVE